MNFFMPTKVITSIGCIKENAAVFKKFGKKAMLVTGKQSAKKNGSQEDVIAALNAVDMPYVIYDQVMCNPTVACVYEGARFARENKVDLIISIGGGSPMDAGKAIALLAVQDIKEEQIFSGEYGDEALPMIHIPTTAGTGSEVTPYAILTNDRAKTKTSIAAPILFPKVALCDPTYMQDLNQTTTINTAIDALSHAIEGMFSIKATPATNALAAESIKEIVSCYESLKEGKLSLEERGILLQASTLAGMVIAHTGTTAVHSMGYSLTYFKDVDHGRANGLLLPYFFKVMEKADGEKVKTILGHMGLSTVEAFESWMDGLLGEKEVLTLEEIEKFATIASGAKNIKNCKVILKREDLVEVYKSAFLKK